MIDPAVVHLTVKDYATRAGVGYSHVYRLVQFDRLPFEIARTPERTWIVVPVDQLGSLRRRHPKKRGLA